MPNEEVLNNSVEEGENPTNAELVEHIVGAIGEVQNAQADLVDGVRKLAEHNLDPNAHGLKSGEGAVYEAVEALVDEMKTGLVKPDSGIALDANGQLIIDISKVLGSGLKEQNNKMSVNLSAIIATEGGLQENGGKLAVDWESIVASGYGLSIRNGKLVFCPFFLGEFYFFRHPTLREGFEVLDGGVIENGAELYPDFWEYIQSSEGQLLCLTATEREALANHVYYTLADGTPITYGGIGGVPFFTIDTATGKIIMPDIRGMHLEAAGFDSLNVGAVAIDQNRPVTGWVHGLIGDKVGSPHGGGFSGALSLVPDPEFHMAMPGGEKLIWETVALDTSKTTPTGAVNAPRRVGVLACAYMGMPAL